MILPGEYLLFREYYYCCKNNDYKDIQIKIVKISIKHFILPAVCDIIYSVLL